jgi:hypothetical protein
MNTQKLLQSSCNTTYIFQNSGPKKWKIKINESKSTQITFSLKKGLCPPMSINNEIIPESSSVRYLGIHLDKTLNLERTHSQKEETHR